MKWPGRGRVAFLVVGVAAVLVLGLFHRSLLQGELAVPQRDGVEYLAAAEGLTQGRGFEIPFGEPG